MKSVQFQRFQNRGHEDHLQWTVPEPERSASGHEVGYRCEDPELHLAPTGSVHGGIKQKRSSGRNSRKDEESQSSSKRGSESIISGSDELWITKVSASDLSYPDSRGSVRFPSFVILILLSISRDIHSVIGLSSLTRSTHY